VQIITIMKINILTKTNILAASIAVLASCGGNASKNSTPTPEEQKAAEELFKATQKVQKDKEGTSSVKLEDLPEEPVFDIVTNYGTMRVKLYSKTPLHRENFAKLALSGFYDGLLFHRVIDGFMIQGGDPLTRDPQNELRYGTGGPDYTVPAEFVPEYKHKKGALAAARRGDAANPLKASSGSQFYIVQNEANCAQLDGQYTVFGETIDGIKTIDKIAAVETNARDLPVEPVTIMEVKYVDQK